MSDFYEVEKIIDKRMEDDQPLYLIKWKDYDGSQNTWEPFENLTNIQEMIDKFEYQLKNRQGFCRKSIQIKPDIQQFNKKQKIKVQQNDIQIQLQKINIQESIDKKQITNFNDFLNNKSKVSKKQRLQEINQRNVFLRQEVQKKDEQFKQKKIKMSPQKKIEIKDLFDMDESLNNNKKKEICNLQILLNYNEYKQNNQITINDDSSSEANYDMDSYYIDQIYTNDFNDLYHAYTILKQLNNYKIETQISQLNIPYLDLNQNILVLDLDETLIQNQQKQRPNCIQFLKNISQYYQLVVFTAAIQSYANKIVKDLNIDFKAILHRDHCIKKQIQNKGQLIEIYIKDLRLINQNTQNIFIVDDNPYSYINNLDNGIPIKKFKHMDNELFKLEEYLKTLAKQRNPLNYNRNYFKLHQFNQQNSINQVLNLFK